MQILILRIVIIYNNVLPVSIDLYVFLLVFITLFASVQHTCSLLSALCSRQLMHLYKSPLLLQHA